MENARGPPPDDRHLIKWLEDQSEADQKNFIDQKLAELFDQAAQPRHASGNGCIKLCYFIEQCKGSRASSIKDVILSHQNCLRLFDFYIEWNEKNQNRSMRQILELVCTLIAQTPNKEVSAAVKDSILHRNLSIIGHKAAQPLVKPAFKSMECLLAKSTISTEEVISAYQSLISGCNGVSDTYITSAVDGNEHSWNSLISEVFDWMTFPDISPAAGKFLVTVFQKLKVDHNPKDAHHTSSWQNWIRSGLTKDPESFENLKYYLFPPLFKLDRPGSLEFLEELNQQKPISNLGNQEIDSQALLQLAALETGKKYGLLEDSSPIEFQKPSKKKGSTIPLQEATIAPLLVHTSQTVRSLAFSVLVSSLSPVRPFTPRTLDILKSGIAILYSDTDAKFRNEIISTSRHMIERLRGAIGFLSRERSSLSYGLEAEQPGEDLKIEVARTRLDTVIALIEKHEEFLHWYLEFLLGELIPTASYQRHSAALQALLLLLQSGISEQHATSVSVRLSDNETVWPFSINFFTPHSLRLLLDLLVDPFEDIRDMATMVLKLASPRAFDTAGSDINDQSVDCQNLEGVPKSGQPTQPLEGFGSLTILRRFLERTEEFSKRTGRADYADGVARCYELLYNLLPSEKERLSLVQKLVDDLVTKVSLAEMNLGQAVLESPVHGAFASLSLVWDSINHSAGSSDLEVSDTEPYSEAWDRLQVRMNKCCRRIWNAVAEVLCNDSPEGHLPQELDDLESIDTKDVLSYSFRAIHESSNLMRIMATKARLTRQDGSQVVSSEVFSDIGNLTFDQLSSLRHRGAFSTVSLTFARFCQLTQYVSKRVDFKAADILQQFYQGALKCIFEQASTTRRSAGIPALITGILSSNAPTPSFLDVMEELKALARKPVHLSETDETNLPQVHAMNCIKEIFKSSTLGKRAEGHLAECLQIAADSLKSEIWAIRNCGLLLLRSLIDCLFGTSESKVITEAGWDGRSIKISYDKYPALPELLLELLDSETDSAHSLNPAIGAVESVFPALDILRRAGPPEVNRDEIFNRVSMHLGSRVWHIRELAARTICTLLLHERWLEDVAILLETSDESSNRLHGTLMAVRFFLERRMSLELGSAAAGMVRLELLLQQSRSSRKLRNTDVYTLTAELELDTTLSKILLRQSLYSKTNPEGPSEGVNRMWYNEVPEIGHDYINVSSHTPLEIAKLRRHIFNVGNAVHPGEFARLIKPAALHNTDVALAGIESISNVFELIGNIETGLQVSHAYTTAIECSGSAEVHAAALIKLFDVLETHKGIRVDLVETVRKAYKFIVAGKSSPKKSNTEIRISGFLLPYFDSAEEQVERVKTWGYMMSSCGNARQDFDTRYAAACALKSFFGSYALADSYEEHFIPPLLALYDTLNDDDDEIRDVGAATVSVILKESLVPLAAQDRFASWLLHSFGGSSNFAWSVVCRMTGNSWAAIKDHKLHLDSTKTQLDIALREDDALFVEEEQNLFIDEVREAKIWSSVFQNLPRGTLESVGPTSNAFVLLAQWATDGLRQLHQIVRKDGPLGWISSPAAYATCIRIFASTNSLLATHRNYQRVGTMSGALSNGWESMLKEVQTELESFLKEAPSREIHQGVLVSLSSVHGQSIAEIGALPARPLFPLSLKGTQQPRSSSSLK